MAAPVSVLAPAVDFSPLFDVLAADSEVREKIRDAVREIEKEERACMSVLNRVHTVDAASTPLLLSTLDPLIPPLAAAIGKLAALIPVGQFYRYSDLFSRALQSASFIAVLRHFLLTEQVMGKKEVELTFAISESWRDHFFLTIEEYLHSLISLLNELSRLAVNRVTLGDFDAPARYARFAKELSSAFSLLNLKNDNLRKRFDGIKYDVKKLEEVVYDLSLRGLMATGSSRAAPQGSEEQGPLKRARTDQQSTVTEQTDIIVDTSTTAGATA